LLPQAHPAPPPLAQMLRDHGRKLVESAYQSFLVDEYARSRAPPCPLNLFTHQWSRWVSEAEKARAGEVPRHELRRAETHQASHAATPVGDIDMAEV
jgi:hypothetical protein